MSPHLPVIEVKNLWKQYTIEEGIVQYNSLRAEMGRWLKRPFRLRSSQPKSFWALKNFSLKIYKGESVGIIGANGAGKSTLLKILSRITLPTKGEVVLRRRVTSLLEVGTGFHPELTGRENIYLNGIILGLSKKEINYKFDEIKEFAGIGGFLDTPTKHYSSGMYTRLAFSVAAHLDPEIFLVDEVLAVGDAQFQKRSMGKMNRIANEGRTVIFVSHNLDSIKRLCAKTVWLKNGELKAFGESQTIINKYLADLPANTPEDFVIKSDRRGKGSTRFTKIYMEDLSGKRIRQAKSGQPIVVVCEYVSTHNRKLENVITSLVFYNSESKRMFKCSSEVSPFSKSTLPAKGRVRCVIPKLPLTPDIYYASPLIKVGKDIEDAFEAGIKLSVKPGDFFETNIYAPRDWDGLDVLVDHNWITE